MSAQKWPWREHLTLEEREELAFLDKEIAFHDESRFRLAQRRDKIRGRGNKRARVVAAAEGTERCMFHVKHGIS